LRNARPRWLRKLLATTLALAMVAPAMAQSREEDKPFYDVSVKEHAKPYIQWTVAVLFMAGVLLIAAKNPHRSHLD
jgi:hypothetical protein